jgi:hypothetical protein
VAEELRPGDERTRDQIRQVYGGSLQGGIIIANSSQSVLLYSDNTVGDQFGYQDFWVVHDDGSRVFHYTGEGQEGHHDVHRRGNGAILTHAERRRTLRLFEACGRPRQRPQIHRYVGDLVLDAADPYYYRDAADRNSVMRRVVVFRLRPVGEVAIVERAGLEDAGAESVGQPRMTRWYPADTDGPEPGSAATVRQAAPERNVVTATERSAMDAMTVYRREAALSKEFQAFLERHGHEVVRYEIHVPGEAAPLWTDLHDLTDGILYEAKSSASRDHIRSAIIQLFDYGRYVKPSGSAILLPEAPTGDRRELILASRNAYVYKDGDTFRGWPVAASASG